MKNIYKVVLAVMLAVFISTTAGAQSFSDILEHSWTGNSVINSDATSSGKIYLSQSLNITVDGSSFTGTSRTSMKMDGTTYRCSAKVSGKVYYDSNSIYIKDEYNTYEDKLPNDLRWCKGWGTLYLYKNSDKSGYYLLKGDISDECGGTSEFEIGDD